ncbi:MAG TPA: hypothetical protein VK550_02900 [Polyangiaceae bacterium]|nr:hypothetical protein [Polyangiaceae bacterium]
MKWILGCMSAALLIGCAAKSVDVGSNHATVLEDGGPGGWPSLAACQSDTQLPIVGTWNGYMERTTLPSRSDAVTLVIAAANASHVCGTITFGTGTPPPVPTDPNSGQIPGITDGGPASNYGGYLIDGYPLTILNGRASLPRLQFEANASQFWKPWCELQTPYLQEGADRWSCVPLNVRGETTYSLDTGCLLGGVDGGASVPVDCAKATLCTQTCSCTATACTVSGEGGGLLFDLRVTGDAIDGSDASGGIHLTRVR